MPSRIHHREQRQAAECGRGERHAVVRTDDVRQAVLFEGAPKDRPGQDDRGGAQALTGEEIPTIAIDECERITGDAVAGLELPFEVGRPDPVRLRHRRQRTPRMREPRPTPRLWDEVVAFQQVAHRRPCRPGRARVFATGNAEQLLRSPSRMMAPRLENAIDQRLRRFVRTRVRTSAPIGQSRALLVAVDHL